MRRDKQWRVNKWADYMASNNYFISRATWCWTEIGVVFATQRNPAAIFCHTICHQPNNIMDPPMHCNANALKHLDVWDVGHLEHLDMDPLSILCSQMGLNSNKDRWNSFLMLSSEWHSTQSGNWQRFQLGCVSARLAQPTLFNWSQNCTLVRVVQVGV